MKIVDFHIGAVVRHISKVRSQSLLWGALVLFSSFVPVAHAEDLPASSSGLKQLSLEQLMDINVTSVSRHPEHLTEVPSAIQVITRYDILRSGVTSLPEALRLASNLEVAQINSNQWAISARGFDAPTSNKLLVLIDGRIVYTPLYAGVFWEVQDTLLEDIDRIEVISGPGATLWGANAVNGVINIITRRAGDTQGLLVAADAGSELRDAARLRWGGSIGQDFQYRVYGKYFERNSSELADGSSAGDSWHMGQGGFRADWDVSRADHLAVQGDGYDGRIGQPAADSESIDGLNLLSRWSHVFSTDSDLKLQFYFDRTHRDIPNGYAEGLNTYSWDFQHHLRVDNRNDLLWGLAYRHTDDAVDGSAMLTFLPPAVSLDYYSAFLQDRLDLIADTLQLTLGSKFEHDPYAGYEYEPSGRLAWHYRQGRTLWLAVSRALRSPSRIDRDFFVPGQPPYLLQGGTDFTSEKLMAYELGYRAQLTPGLLVSLSTFYNVYDDLRGAGQLAPPAQYPVVINNGQRGDGYGAELAVTWQAADVWKLHFGYDELHVNIDPRQTGEESTGEANDPRHQLFLRSALDLSRQWEVDGAFRYISRLNTMQVPDYGEMDLRINWKPPQPRNLQISLAGQNLLQSRHAEFGNPGQHREIQRGVYGELSWHF